MVSKRLRIPRVVISAPQGQSGKTTVSIGLIGALVDAGLKIQPFKKGPDFIDPSWLSRVSGRLCRNLDCFLMDDEEIKGSVARAAMDADLAVIEGAMGMFDGVDLEGSGSTAQIAKIIKAPVILVIDCHRMTRSAAAIVKGFKDFDRKVYIAGVILNNVARPRHLDMLTRSIEEYCRVPVLGSIPKNSLCAIPNRHLGLIPAEENNELQTAINSIVRTARENLDLEKIREIGRRAPALQVLQGTIGEKTRLLPPQIVTIGVIRDRAFSFYYPENLESLERAGARLVFIDALRNTRLPEMDAMFIGGGFPEIFSKELSENKHLRYSIGREIEQGLPVYAECGGLMYLGRSIIKDGKNFPMVGALPFDVVVKDRPQGHGYTIMKVESENPFFSVNTCIQGHEFHNSCLTNLDTGRIRFAYQVHRGHGIDGKRDGIVYKNVLASYHHVHALGAEKWAEHFVAAADNFRKSKKESFIPYVNVGGVM